MGVKITGGGAAKLEGAVSQKPTFEAAEETPEPVKTTTKKKVQVTKPDIEIPPEFEPNWGYDEGTVWKPMSSAPKDKIILVACCYERDPGKWFYWPVKWFVGPHGAAFYICGTQWHSLDPEVMHGWTEDVGHP